MLYFSASRLQALIDRRYAEDDVNTELKTITLSELLAYTARLFQNVFVECFSNGNITPEVNLLIMSS